MSETDRHLEELKDDDSNLERLRDLSKKLSDTEYLLTRSNALLAAIVNGADEAILAKDLEGTINAWNPAAEKLYGYSAPEIIGQPISLIVPKSKLGELHWIMENVREGRPIKAFNTTRKKKDGTEIEIVLTVSPIQDASGAVVGASEITHPKSWKIDE